MTERERAINQDLHVLDEAHRLGRISRAEYRARRRRVLQSLYDSSGVVTARKTLLKDATTTPHARAVHGGSVEAAGGSGHHALTTLLSMRPGPSRGPMLVILVGVVLLVVLGGWWWLHH
ncbi:MAG TPA: hypothetical protein VN043_11260 [Rhodanobacter sp.]|nr:hypothetical protein [Rhodanobacter sp.]